MLAEVLQDNECRNKLYAIYLRVDTLVKKMDSDTEVMRQGAESRVC
jgi:hypothetical protein